MAEAKPITLTVVDAADYTGPAPQPYAVVGGLVGGVTPQEAPAIETSPADAGEVAADLQLLVDALIAAGVLTE